jgi:hypothetical protein
LAATAAGPGGGSRVELLEPPIFHLEVRSIAEDRGNLRPFGTELLNLLKEKVIFLLCPWNTTLLTRQIVLPPLAALPGIPALHSVRDFLPVGYTTLDNEVLQLGVFFNGESRVVSLEPPLEHRDFRNELKRFFRAGIPLPLSADIPMDILLYYQEI